MNKLIINSENKSVENYEGLIICENDTIINVSGICNLYFHNNFFSVTFNILDNAFVNIYSFSKNKKGSSKININSSNNTKVKLVNSYENISETNDYYEISASGDNNECSLYTRVIGKYKTNIKAKAVVSEGTKDNIFLEDIKVYAENNSVTIEPILLIDTFDCIANHKAVITNLENIDMFYIESKGIDKKLGASLIKDGFLTSEFSDEFKKIIKGEKNE